MAPIKKLNAATVEIFDPLIEPRMQPATRVVKARPPGIRPNTISVSATRRAAMPVRVSKLPAMMKSGVASNVNESSELEITKGMMLIGAAFNTTIVNSVAPPRDTNTGTLSASKPKKTKKPITAGLPSNSMMVIPMA
jgi:hypothetical protein